MELTKVAFERIVKNGGGIAHLTEENYSNIHCEREGVGRVDLLEEQFETQVFIFEQFGPLFKYEESEKYKEVLKQAKLKRDIGISFSKIKQITCFEKPIKFTYEEK